MIELAISAPKLAAAEKFFQTLPSEVRTRVARGVVRAGANFLAEQIRAAAPMSKGERRVFRGKVYRRGDYQRSVRVRVNAATSFVETQATAGPRIFYAHMIERGHFARDGKTFIAARPVVRQVFANFGGRAADVMAAAYVEAVEKSILKNAGRNAIG